MANLPALEPVLEEIRHQGSGEGQRRVRAAGLESYRTAFTGGGATTVYKRIHFLRM